MMPLHHELKQPYRARSFGKLKNFTSSCLLEEKHPETLQVFVFIVNPWESRRISFLSALSAYLLTGTQGHSMLCFHLYY
jgi:hypothetical protein